MRILRKEKNYEYNMDKRHLSNTTPLEENEQRAFVQWLELVGLKFTAVPNSTYTTSWKQKSRNHYMGLRPGLPDLLVLIPPDRSRGHFGHLVFVEMKRKSGGVVSPAQREWIDALIGLGSPNVSAVIGKGAEAAIEQIKMLLGDSHSSPF